MRKMHRDLKKLAKRFGGKLQLSTNANPHPRILLPNGRYVVCSQSPSCSRAMKNLETSLRHEMSK